MSLKSYTNHRDPYDTWYGCRTAQDDVSCTRMITLAGFGGGHLFFAIFFFFFFFFLTFLVGNCFIYCVFYWLHGVVYV